MNKWIFKAIIGVVCLGAAGVGGYFAWKKYGKRFKKEENEPIEVTYVPFKPEKEPIMRDPDDKKVSNMDISKSKFATGLHDYMQIPPDKMESFESYLASLESPEDDDEEEDDDSDEDDIHNFKDRAGPYQITAGEFCNTRTYYDKASLNYFSKDKVVTDDHDQVMENDDLVLGDLQEAFNRAGSSSIIYIRNEELEIDYEVNYVEGSYRKEVLGLDEEV